MRAGFRKLNGNTILPCQHAWPKRATIQFTMHPPFLSPAQLERYQCDGFLVLPGFNTHAEIAGLRQRALAIVDALDANQHRTIFSTQEQSRCADAYFMASAHTISCFFEEEAFDADGRLKQAKRLSINKIGHALHVLDAVFKDFSHTPALNAVALDVGLAEPQIRQSMVIFKQPRIGGEVRWHQDATFFVTTPQTVTTFWFALEDATLENGCLWVQPGGHHGPLREQFVRTGESDSPVLMLPLDPSPWPPMAEALPLEVSAGTLVLLHGLLPHYSAANRSARSRLAYTLHMTDAQAAYSPANWLQPQPILATNRF